MDNYLDTSNFWMNNNLFYQPGFGTNTALTPSFNFPYNYGSLFNFTPSVSSGGSSGSLTAEQELEKLERERENERKAKEQEREKAVAETTTTTSTEDADGTIVDESNAPTEAEMKILAEEYEKKVLNPPSESLGTSIVGQTIFGSAIAAPGATKYMRAEVTRSELSPIAKEAMKAKVNNPFKERQEFNKAIDELTKAIGKLEKAKRVDSDLFNNILKESQEAIKSGEISKIQNAAKAAEMAKKARTVEAYNTAVKEAAEAAEKAAAETAAGAAERAATEAATGAAERATTEAATGAAAKTAGKTALKSFSKYIPWIGNALFAGMEIYSDWDKLKAAKKEGGGALAKQCVHTGVKTAAVVGGFALGMKAGAAIGTCIPIPVVGTLVGAVAGGIIGGAISFFAGKLANKATTAVIGPEPGVKAQKDEKMSKKNNNYRNNGKVDVAKFNKSGHSDVIMNLVQLYQTNGIGEDGISANTAKILQKYQFIQPVADAA